MKGWMQRRATVLTAFLVASLFTSISPAHGVSIGSGNCVSAVGNTTGVTTSTNGSLCLVIFKPTSNTSTLSTNWTVPSGVTQVRLLLIGGGGGGGSDYGGGGGGGQVRDLTYSVTPNSSPNVVVGAGGTSGNGTYSTGSTLNNTGGVTGTSTTFEGMVTALGGSGAVGRTKSTGTAAGWDSNGYTGGGGGISATGSSGTAGATYKGGNGGTASGGGGGGSGGAGIAGSSGTGGAGGTGSYSDITGTNTCYGGGGGGGTNTAGAAGTASCGGAAGSVGNPTPTEATLGTGGGGGGGGGNASVNGGQGGAGLLVISFPPAQTITFTQLADQNVASSSAALTATASSGLAVSFSSSTTSVCTISGSSVVLKIAGTCTVVASQSGSSSFQSAPNSSMTFLIVGVLYPTISSSAPFIYRTAETITISTPSVAGKVTFKLNKTRIPGCISRTISSANSYSVTCNWKPSIHGSATIYISITPSSGPYLASTTTYPIAHIAARSNNR